MSRTHPGSFRRSWQGGIAGVAGTTTMSGVLAFSDWAGVMNSQPPKLIVEHFLPDLADEETDALAVAAHVGYGAASGSLYGALVGPEHRGMKSGVLFGILLWAVSYEGWLPKLGIMPPAHKDTPGRAVTMFVAHLVYGATLGRAAKRLSDR